jgi:alkanesulfonate monooxygenase SsuD/methylene tetrahydromethanopterin reductase-like flavin-dependent oxidoreductase (luciferase family)
MRYAVGLPNVGEFGDVRALVELARAAERHGWDGVQLWDHVLHHDPDWPVTSGFVAASAIAATTGRLRIILTVALPRRQVQDVARDIAAIDALSGRRLTVVATIGSMDREYTEFGLDPDLRTRGRLLDERLVRLTDLWARWRVPRVPIWCGGRWPNRAGLRRAARYDGAMPLFADQRARNVPVEEFRAAASFVRDRAASVVDLALEGASRAATDVTPYADAGLTWWIEALGWWRGGTAAGAARIAAGAPREGSVE